MSEQQELIAQVLRSIDLLGVVTNALLGAAVARQFNLDPVGFAIISMISALGGGAIRDVLLNQTPIALTDGAYLGCALVASGLAFLVRFEGRRWRQVFPYVDALALGAWAVAGTQKALLTGISPLPAVLLGVLTAVGGGAVRDVMLGQVPSIFRRSELYATAALAGALVYLFLREVVGPYSAPGGVLVGAGVCLLARRLGWVLPTEPAILVPQIRGKAINRFRRRG
ncbi:MULTISPECIES: trimeric intracellular cation channel family protein [Janibacter]|uniref:trimeric intracellular cation channel family protein n=1 Tax=Janibacter TaxID=53457 RepID=UPI001F07AA9E|nr:trimeric intracellular cation channel family protein [Janibacter melonis]